MSDFNPEALAQALGLQPGELNAVSVQSFLDDLKSEMAKLDTPRTDPNTWQDDLAQEISALAVDREQIRTELDEITGTGTIGAATVELNAFGGLSNLRLRGTNPASDLEALNAALAEAIDLARQDAREQRREVLARFGVTQEEAS